MASITKWCNPVSFAPVTTVAWTKVGTVALAAGTGPAAYNLPAQGGINVLYVDSATHALKNIVLSTGAETDHGGYVTASPSAVVNDSFFDVFVRGESGALWQIGYYGAGYGWSGWIWIPNAGYLHDGTGPAAISVRPGEVDVFVAGASGEMWQKHYGLQNSLDPTTKWQVPWTDLHGYLSASPGAAKGLGSYDCAVFVRGASGSLWWDYANTVAATATTPTAYPWTFYQGPITNVP